MTVASIAHSIRAAIHFDDLQWERSYNRVAAYGQSKLANLMFTYELQRRLAPADAPTIAVAAHPGLSEHRTDAPPAGSSCIRASISSARWSPTAPRWERWPRCGRPPIRACRAAQYYGPDGIRELRGHPKLVQSSKQSHD